MSLDTKRSADQLQSRLDREQHRRRTTRIAVVVALALVAVCIAGFAAWRANRHQEPAPAARPHSFATKAWSVPGGPVAVYPDQFSQDGTDFWVALRDDRALVRWSSKTGAVSDRIALPGAPVALTSPDPHVGVLVKNGTASTLAFVDVLNRTLTGTVPLPGDVVSVKSTEDNQSVVFLDRAGHVGMVNATTNRITVHGPTLGALSAAPAGARLLAMSLVVTDPVAAGVGDTLVLLDQSTLAVLRQIPLASTVVGVTHGPVREDPWIVGLADGRLVSVTETGTISTLANSSAGTPWPSGTSVLLVGADPAVLIDASGRGILSTGGTETAGAVVAADAQGSWYVAEPDADRIVSLTGP